MSNRKYIGHFISLKFKDRPTPVSGFVIDYNDNWTLLKQNSGDYMIDGYIIVRHKNLEGFSRGKEEILKERVLRLKNLQPTDKEKIPIKDLETILTYITKHFKLFQFEQKSEKSCWLGKLNIYRDKEFILKPILPNGKWDKDTLFFTKDIRTIEFNTDYINSLKLIDKDNIRKKTTSIQKQK